MQKETEQLLTRYETGEISRRGFIAALSALTALSAGRVSAQATPPIEITSINHVTFFVKDIPESAAFYQKLFGLNVLSDQGAGINLATGKDGQFLGFYGGTSGTDTDIHHVCLGVKNFDLDKTLAYLKEQGIEAQVRMRDDTVPEIYFQDPNGIMIQLQDESYCGGSGVLGNVCPV